MTGDIQARAISDAVTQKYRELTPAAVILGIFQGIILNLAFVYAALELGFSIGGSTVAAITGYALLRGVLRKGTMIENNINQTIASGINTAGTGVVFTLPALFMLDAKWRADGLAGIEFSPWPLLLGGIAGAVLGVVLIIPLRKQMLEYERHRFPSGIAVAALLKSPGAGKRQAILLLAGFLIATLFFLFLGTVEIPAPGPDVCGLDPTPDFPDNPEENELGCETYLTCD